MSYTKNKKNAKTKSLSKFIKFDFNDIKQPIIKISFRYTKNMGIGGRMGFNN